MRKLIKKQYLGVGYVHQFVDTTTGETKYLPCSQEDYDNLADKNNTPVLDNCTWVSSSGGTMMVDNPDTVLKEDEYCEYNNGYYVFTKDTRGIAIGINVKLTDIINDMIEESIIKSI